MSFVKRNALVIYFYAVLWGGALVAVATSGCSSWAPRDRALGAFAVGCHAVDLYQTEWALENGFRERNPLLDDHPSDAELVGFKLAALGAGSWLFNKIDPEARTPLLVVATLPCVFVVIHNHREGARP